MPEISSQSLEFFIFILYIEIHFWYAQERAFFLLLQTEETRTLLSVDAYSSEKDTKKRIILFVIELGFVLLLHFDAQEESMILRLATMCACVLRLACRWWLSLREADEQTNSRRWFWYIEGSAEYNHWKIKNWGEKDLSERRSGLWEGEVLNRMCENCGIVSVFASKKDKKLLWKNATKCKYQKL